MDKIIIRQLRLQTVIGLYPWERAVRQTLLLDLDLATDIRQAAADDDLQHTIDYSAVCQAIVTLADAGRFKLIETLAEKIAAMVQQQFAVSWLRVSVCKADVMTNVASVGVEIERGQWLDAR